MKELLYSINLDGRTGVPNYDARKSEYFQRMIREASTVRELLDAADWLDAEDLCVIHKGHGLASGELVAMELINCSMIHRTGQQDEQHCPWARVPLAFGLRKRLMEIVGCSEYNIRAVLGQDVGTIH